MTNLKIKKAQNHTYTVKGLEGLEGLDVGVFPTVHMEISEEASIEEHLYAFERFLQGIGFSLPENAHLDFIENEAENRNFEDLTINEGDSQHSKNGTN
jgi:hypothetical protein